MRHKKRSRVSSSLEMSIDSSKTGENLARAELLNEISLVNNEQITSLNIHDDTIKNETAEVKADDDGFVKVSRKKRKLTKPSFRPNVAAVNKPLNISDIRDLVMWCFNDGINPRYMMVTNRQHIQKFVVMNIPGLHPAHIATCYTMETAPSQPLQLNVKHNGIQGISTTNVLRPENLNSSTAALAAIFSHLYPVKGPGDRNRLISPLTAFVSLPISTQEKKAQQRIRGTSAATKNNRKWSCHELMMTTEQFTFHAYPQHPILANTGDPTPLAPDWVMSDLSEFIPPNDSDRKLLALDCEMCVTEKGFELTRLSVVNEQHEMLYDELILPSSPILDYVTKYSGVTAKAMEGVTTTLANAQDFLLKTIDDKTILVGHSLENDLRALKFVHPYIIDTAVAIPHLSNNGMYKARLKVLAKTYLKREIQMNDIVIDGVDTTTHDSVEDALACLDLVLMRMAGEINDVDVTLVDTEHLLTRLRRGNRPKRSAWIDGAKSCTREGAYADKVYVSNNDEQVLSHTVEALDSNADFIWCRFRDIERHYENLQGSIQPKSELNTIDGSTAMETNKPMDEVNNHIVPPSHKTESTTSASRLTNSAFAADRNEMLQNILRTCTIRIGEIWRQMPSNSVLVLFSANNDMGSVNKLIETRNNLRQSMGWTEEHRTELWRQMSIAKTGCCFFALKE